MEIEPIAYFRSPFATKFGIPKQSGLADSLRGTIEFVPKYRNADALRGIDGFDFLWLIWEFSANRHEARKPVVRPPRLGGNEKMGVFATRSPFRPNRLGADLMDGTPIYDIKPYVTYADSHPEARSGFVDSRATRRLNVIITDKLAAPFSADELSALRKVLELDPRPQYHSNPEKVYGMAFAGKDVRFRVNGEVVEVVEVEEK